MQPMQPMRPIPSADPQPQPGTVLVPPRFAARFRSGLSLIAITLIIGGALLYGLYALITPMWGPPVVLRLIGALPPLCVLATAIALLSARRCLSGLYLIVEKARTARNLIVGSFLANVLTSAVTLIVGLSQGFGGYGAFASLPFLFIGATAAASGHMFVRPTTQTLRRFADHPVW